jgi:hypothetical protein
MANLKYTVTTFDGNTEENHGRISMQVASSRLKFESKSLDYEVGFAKL